jgi:hypothetical protein
LVWLAEAAIGLIPLGAHYVVATTVAAQSRQYEAMCSFDLKTCHLLGETPHAEICILAVVTSGVSAIAALGFGLHSRKSPPNWMTYSLLTLSLFALILGVLMYVVASMGALAEQASWATWMTLVFALFASLLLSLERATR